MKCTSCNHLNKDSALFCVECGAPFYKKCSKCNTDSLVSYKFCPKCGNAFDIQKEKLSRYLSKLTFVDDLSTRCGRNGRTAKGLLLARKNNLYGVFNISTATLVIPCEYENTTALELNTHILLKKNNKWYIYNPVTGQRMNNDSFDDIKQDDFGYFVEVKRNDLWGVVSCTNGNYVIPCEYDSLEWSGSNAFNAEKNGLWGCIRYSDLGHRITVPFEYFKLDTHGHWDKPSPSQHISGKWGVIDNNGKIIIDFIYDEIEYQVDFCRSLYFYRKLNKWGSFYSGGSCGRDIIHPCIYTYEDIKRNYWRY